MSSASSTSFWHRLDSWLAVLRRQRTLVSLALDALIIALSWNATYLFRLGFERFWSARPGYDVWVMCGVVLVYLAVFAWLRVPQGLWRFAGFGEVKRLALACFAGGLISAAWVMGAQLYQVPRAVLALHPLMAWFGVVSARLGYRMLYEQARKSLGGDEPLRRALVLGAGEAARRLLAGIHQQGWKVLGLLDDDPAKHGARISGLPVLGPLDAVADKGLRADATHLIVALPSATLAQRKRALELASATGLPVLTVPSAEELRLPGSRIEGVRQIEPEDLLGREPVLLDESRVGQVLRGQTVFVTGAGGSIGSELCRQVASFQPARLVLYELSEFNLYAIEQELGRLFPQVQLVRLVGDVKDPEHLKAACLTWRPAVVFHAAAYKHVPLMEEHNAAAALRNNTWGTWVAGQAAAACGAQRFVLISTDKAVNPTNVMGATKRAAEMAVSLLAETFPQTRFMAVRFGNVLGSSGSVIPKFKEQIARGGPITVTHPDIIRYFMTIPEAARLVLQAAAIGESGQVLVLDMGEPVRIVDLARTMIRLSGHSEAEIDIVFSGLRPGEKLYEELLADADATLPTQVPRLRIAQLKEMSDPARMQQWLHQLNLAGAWNDNDVRQALRQVVAEYQLPVQPQELAEAL